MARPVLQSALKRGTDLSARAARTEWSPSALAGRLVELSGAENSAALTCAFGLVRQAQLLGDPVAWIGTTRETFFPPDVAAGGVDLASLAIVRVPNPRDLSRATDQLARCGAFALLIVDICKGFIRMAELSRLLGLAQRHNVAIVFLTDKPDHEASLGSLVSLRGRVQRTHTGLDEFVCTLEALKDKKCAPGWQVTVVCGGPAGLH
jgi:recombination protein RecA